MSVCLLPEQIDNFKQALQNKDLKFSDLLDPDMTSEARTEIFKEYAGDNAADVNKLFEQKLVLKNKELGMKNLFNKLVGEGKYASENIAAAQEHLATFRASQQERIMNPTEHQAFLNTLADKLTGTHVSREVASQVFNLSQKAEEAKAAVKEDDPAGSESRLNYGATKVALDNYVSGIKNSVDKVTLQDFKNRPVGTTVDSITKVAALAKELKSTGDISSLLRQGLKVVFSHPGIWFKDAAKTFSDVVKQMGKSGTDVSVRDAIQADIVSRPYAMDGTYQKMGLDTATNEELYPSQTAEKIPLLGRVVASSRVGYEGFLHRSRADLADMYIDMAKASGLDITDKEQLEPIGKMVNALTGRGYLGRTPSEALSAAFWSPRMIKSDFDFLTAHQGQKSVTPFVRKQAAINLVRTVTGVAGVLALAKAIAPKSVTSDSRSTKFGKITVDNVSYDITGGSGTLAVLASRLIQNAEVSSKGKTIPLNTGKYGAPTSGDVIWDFLSGKASPAASLALDLANRSGFAGAPLNPTKEAINLVAPFPVQNIMDATPQVGLPDAVVGEILDSLGLYETIPTPPTKK